MKWSIIVEGQKLFLAKEGKKLPQHQLWDKAAVRAAGAAFSPQVKAMAFSNLLKKFEDLEDGPNQKEGQALLAQVKSLI